jgi:DnaA-homolog protein
MTATATPQLTLPLMPPPEPGLGNFVPGRNEELLALLRRLPTAVAEERIVFLWGEVGCGKTHLLQAVCREPWPWPATYVQGGFVADPFLLVLPATVAIDDVERLNPEAQLALFNLVNRIREEGGVLLACGAAPPAHLGVPLELASRLASGLVFRVQGLSDEEKALALREAARARGFVLPEEVGHYLLRHYPRDMPRLVQLLGQLDEASLALGRPITVPLVRALLRDPA